ncbi:50S ribosomal protein L11 methyltransferase, partial [Burkholderia cenocepacia]|uniref:50S ribosomal protein L11 methyltransferase n=1 Tax=Burkholderia cenocepacia TaxID=95486 RepID=UPI00406C8B2E
EMSVSVEDADTAMPAEPPLFGEPGLVPDRTAWQHSRVVALLSADHEPDVLLAAAANEIDLAETPQFVVREVEEQDWVRLTQSQFEPIPIGERLWVVPSWHDAPDPYALVLQVDSFLPFATCIHPTTRLFMQWLHHTRIPAHSV